MDICEKFKTDTFDKIITLLQLHQNDINAKIIHKTGAFTYYCETPLLYALKRIKDENDVFYTVTKLLLDFDNIDVHAQCGRYWDGVYDGTIITELCSSKKTSKTALNLMLQERKFDRTQLQKCFVRALLNNRLDLAHVLLDIDANILGKSENKSPEKDRKCGKSTVISRLKESFLVDPPRRIAMFEFEIENDRFSPILEVVLRARDDRHFQTSEATVEALYFMLEHGADANVPRDLLAYAINYSSSDVCAILLQHGANPNSYFVRQKFNHEYYGHETALHAACRLGSQQKIDLLLLHGACRETKWLDKKPDETLRQYGVLHRPTQFTLPSATTTNNINRIMSCRDFMRQSETKAIYREIIWKMNHICRFISSDMQKELTVSLSGSFAENTKCFSPDEFDFLFNVREQNYKAFISLKNEIIEKTATLFQERRIRQINQEWLENDNLQAKSFLLGNKTPRIHFIWEGEFFKKLDILADIIVCCPDVSEQRHVEEKKRDRLCIQQSQLQKEMRIENSYSSAIRSGYILAKAVRISSIAKPTKIERFDLEENINVDDVITSYMLKSCLFDSEKLKPEFENCTSAHEVAVNIYTILAQALRKKLLESMYTRTNLVDCRYCHLERGCCKRRQLLHAMVENILKFLAEHKHELQDVSFASDDFDFGVETENIKEKKKITCSDDTIHVGLTNGHAATLTAHGVLQVYLKYT